MQEGSLKAGDIADKWVVDKPIGWGSHGRPCVYEVHHTDPDYPPRRYAMKIREPDRLDYFNAEIEVLKGINANGPHPSFQRLIDYNSDPENLYMILSPLMPPERKFKDLSLIALAEINPTNFMRDFFRAIRFGLLYGIHPGNISPDHFFVTEAGGPFFIGLADEIAPYPRSLLDIKFLDSIYQRFIEAAEYRGRETARKEYEHQLNGVLERTVIEISLENDR